MCRGNKIGTKEVLWLWVFLQLLTWKWFIMLKRNITCVCKKLYPTLKVNYPSLPRRQSQCISWDPLAGTCFHWSKKVSNLIEDWGRTALISSAFPSITGTYCFKELWPWCILRECYQSGNVKPQYLCFTGELKMEIILGLEQQGLFIFTKGKMASIYLVV